MNELSSFAAAPHLAASQGRSLELAGTPRRPKGLLALVSAWRGRVRLRRELEEKLRAAPHLMADMGVTEREAEAEIAKPFWRE